MNTKIIIVVIILLAIGLIGYLALQKQTPSNSTSTTTTNSSSTNSQTAASVIKYTSSGFSPSSITIKSGQSVTFENDSSSLLQVDSNPHPIHTENTELNIGSIAVGQQQSVVLTKTGSWGYHNHLNPTDTGTIIVQ